MNDQIRLALVGAGVVAEKKHLPALAGLEQFRIVAVVDPDEARRRKVIQMCPGAAELRSLSECLERVDFDAVAVLTPPRNHIPLVAEALEANKFVLVEKPLCLDLDEAEALVAHPRASMVQMGFHMRCHRLVEQTRSLLGQGAIGQVQGIRGAWCAPRPPDQSEWKNQRRHGGGALIELAVHFYDLVRFLTDSELCDVSAHALSAARDDEAGCVLGHTVSDVPFSGLFSERASHQLEFEIYGSDGRIKLDCLRFDGFEKTRWGEDTGSVGYRLRRAWQTLRDLPVGIRSLQQGGDYLLSYRRQWEHFGEVVRGNSEPTCTVEDGIEALRAVTQSLQS